MFRHLLAGCAVALIALAGLPAAAQSILPVVQTGGGPRESTPVTNIGYDSVTGDPCAVGATATCGLVTSASSPASSPAATTDISGAVTTGGAYQTVVAASANRKGCAIQNNSALAEPLLIKVGTMASPFELTRGAIFNCTGPNSPPVSLAVTVSAATTGHTFVGVSQ